MIDTREQAMKEAKRRGWPHPVLMKHPHADRYFVCAEMGGNVFGHGDTWEEAHDFLVQKRRERVEAIQNDLDSARMSLKKARSMKPPDAKEE